MKKETLEKGKQFEKPAQLINEKTGEEILLPTYFTTQLLEKSVKVDSVTNELVTVESYRMDIFAISSLSDPKQDYDTTYSVLGTNTIYYDMTYLSGGFKAYKFIQVTAKWDRLDSAVTWSGATMSWYQEGEGYDSSGTYIGPVNIGESVPVAGGYPTSGQVYYLNTNSTNYVKEAAAYMQAGTQRIFITRGGSTWEFRLINTIG